MRGWDAQDDRIHAWSNATTVRALRQLERREWAVESGAVEIGGTTLESLERYLGAG